MGRFGQHVAGRRAAAAPPGLLMCGAVKPGLFAKARDAEQRGNREGRDLWGRYATHRDHVTAAALALAPPAGGRLCWLGAGNANDIDLERLADRFSEVHLVDIDEAALQRAAGRQSPQVRARLHHHAPVDLSGLYEKLDLPAARRPTGEALVNEAAAAVLSKLPADFDVVVSGCILSQMSWALSRLAATTLSPAELPPLEQALATVHLRTLLGLVAPAGTALLVADLVSSSAYPLDELEPDADLAALVKQLSFERQAYAVCNPELLRQLLRRDRHLRAICAPPEIGSPWLWTGSKDQTYLVYPMLLRRQATP
jgi:hypothetical protein